MVLEHGLEKLGPSWAERRHSETVRDGRGVCSVWQGEPLHFQWEAWVDLGFSKLDWWQ